VVGNHYVETSEGRGIAQDGVKTAISGAKDSASDLSFLLLEQAQILDGELPEDPAAFANRLNQLVLRGVLKETS